MTRAKKKELLESMKCESKKCEPADTIPNKYPIVLLTRIADEEILKFTKYVAKNQFELKMRETTSESTEKLSKSSMKTVSAKRKSNTVYTTQAKKKKSEDEIGLPSTEIVEKCEQTPIEAHTNCTKSEKNDSNKNVVAHQFSKNEIVWAKIRGSVHWPAKITAIGQRQFEVYWFNDYRRSKVFRTQIFKFYPNFEKFSVHFTTSVGLETAAKEALIYLANK